MIKISGLSKTFSATTRGGTTGEVRALDSVDLDIEENEFVSLLGPSGCGKTTLLRVLAGLETADAGEALVAGRPISGPSPDRAMVFQRFALLPWATVLRNVTFGLELQKVPREKRTAKARELIEMVGLTGFENSRPAQLSGGMQQRVGLARALAVDPTILLMDEPFGALDEQTKWLLQEELLRIWERDRKTVMFVTHSIDEAILLSDRIVIMSARPGRIVECVPVNLPRPRSRDDATGEIAALRHYLWDRLRGLQDGAVAEPMPS